MSHETEFYLQAARALAGCQLVEQALKLYISEALLLAKKRIGTTMTFRMSGDDYEDAPLGQLLKVFGKLNDNDHLKSALAIFNRERIFLSHQAITSCIDPGGDLSPSTADTARLVRIDVEARRLAAEVHDQGRLIFAALHFDPIDPE